MYSHVDDWKEFGRRRSEACVALQDTPLAIGFLPRESILMHPL
jgi:hypothetical protein